MNDRIIDVRNLRRSFDDVEAVRGVSFSIERGQVVGFIGANGAGKTTTMKILATLDLPTSGSVSVCGYDAVHERNLVRARIGWMPDSYGTYENTTVWEYLDFFARAYGFSGGERHARVEEVMEFTNLSRLAERDTASLSKGMSQRLCLARMLLPDPEVLILDEPAAGLDPEARIEFKHLVRILAEEGKTLFISSHILSELEDMCDTILFINEGSIVHHGSAESLKLAEGSGWMVDVRILGDVEALSGWCAFQPGIEVVEAIRSGYRLMLEEGSPEKLQLLLQNLIRSGVPVIEFVQVKRRLEEAFVELLQSRREPGNNEEASG